MTSPVEHTVMHAHLPEQERQALAEQVAAVTAADPGEYTAGEREAGSL